MSNFVDFLRTLVPGMRSQRERDEGYLAEAMDLYDLERRIRQIEARDREARSDVPLGLGLW
jgi:hypothetical protein